MLPVDASSVSANIASTGRGSLGRCTRKEGFHLATINAQISIIILKMLEESSVMIYLSSYSRNWYYKSNYILTVILSSFKYFRMSSLILALSIGSARLLSAKSSIVVIIFSCVLRFRDSAAVWICCKDDSVGMLWNALYSPWSDHNAARNGHV